MTLMKFTFHHPSSHPQFSARPAGAFTLAELMTTVAIFSLVVIAMVSLQIFGFKMNSFTSNKLKSTSACLKTLNQMRNQIREATNAVLIGNFNAGNNTFAAVANSYSAIGDAVQISNNPTSLVTFYLNTNTDTLYELGNDTNSELTVLARNIINSQPFQAVNWQGDTVNVGSSDHYTIQMTLQFSNLVYSVPTPVYDTYHLESCATPREQFNDD